MQWKVNQVLEPIFHGHLWKTLLRNAAKLKISINNSVHSCRQEKYKVIIKLFLTTLLLNIFLPLGIFYTIAHSTSCGLIKLGKSHFSEIAAHKTAWKIIRSIEGLYSRDKFCYSKTVTDVTLTLIKKPLSVVEKWKTLIVVIMVCYLYHQYAKTDFGDENITHRLNISKKNRNRPQQK